MINKLNYNYFNLALLFIFPWQLFSTNFNYDLNFFIKLIIGLFIVLFFYFFLILILSVFKKKKINLDKIIFALLFCFFLETSVFEIESQILRVFLVGIIFIVIFFIKEKKIFNSILVFSVLFVVLTFIKGNFVYITKKHDNNNNITLAKKETFANNNKKSLIIIFLDELSSLKYFNESNFEIKKDVEEFRNVFLKYDFIIPQNVFSNYSETIYSIPSVLNSYNDVDVEKLLRTYSRNNIYINLNQNKLFQDWNKKIHIFQDSAVNFCAIFFPHIVTCETKSHIPVPSTSEFLAKNSSIKIFYNKIYYFIHYKLKKFYPDLFFRIYLKRNSKSSFKQTLEKINNLLSDNRNKQDLFFVHALTPHGPFTYTNDCNHGFIDNDNLDLITKKKLHAHELKCLSKEFDNFFYNLMIDNNFKDLEIIITSDHGNRLENNFISQNSTFFAYKGNRNLIIEKDQISIQNLVPKIIYEDFEENLSLNKKIYNKILNKFETIN
jgi:hypothetical protein